MPYTLWVSVALLLAESDYSSEKYINYNPNDKKYQTGETGWLFLSVSTCRLDPNLENNSMKPPYANGI